MVNIDTLKAANLQKLEDIYLGQGQDIKLKGIYDGVFLKRLDKSGSRKPMYIASKAFEIVPFGIDFDSNQWFFGNPLFQAGRFKVSVGKSRWRECNTQSLHYEVSRLPGFVKNVLYDEVKPLSANLCIAIGGINEEAGPGDHFFFALQRRLP